jgi:pyruvate kinase
MLRTKIVCTIGPASREPETLQALIRAGMDVARLNFSHGDQASHAENVARIRAAADKVGRPVGILADLQGPKLRVGGMAGDGVELVTGEEITLTTRPVTGREGEIPVQYHDLPQVVTAGERILLDDGLMEIIVLETKDTDIRARVVTGGLLRSNKGLNLPYASLSIPAITEKDRHDLSFALAQQVDWIGLSFVRTASEVLELKELIRQQSTFGRPVLVIAKIEKPEAVRNIDDIVAATDGVMVARGDLAVETSSEEVPVVQKMIIHKANQAGKPVITATQMLESMMHSPRPTRAEASDVANAILDGTDAIMLSDETAAGQYPVLAVQTMVKIAERAETSWGATICARGQLSPQPGNIAEAVAHATRQTAADLGVATIITPTVSGATARLLAKYRPEAPIIAVTPDIMTQRQLTLTWGVTPVLCRRATNTDEIIADAIQTANAQGICKQGDVVVITAGSPGAPGTTNLMKVQIIERILAQGTGIGRRSVTGRVRIIAGGLGAHAEFEPDTILVAPAADRTFVPVVQHVAGLVAKEAGLNSHAAILAIEYDIPTVVGVQNALDVLHDGQEVTLDAVRGVIYEGRVAAT